MSKYILRKRTIGFTTISNNVIKALKSNLEALGLYTYLLSLPDDWKFYKTNLCKECDIGVKKLSKLLSILCKFQLLNIVQIRDAQGRFSHFDISIYDIEYLKINNIDNNESIVQPEGLFCHTVETAARKSAPIKETYTNEKEEITKEIYCASDDARHLAAFITFWSIYPVKKNKKRALRIWNRLNLNENAHKIIEDIKRRKKFDQQWQDIRYIPHPTTYLNGERWEDDIVIEQPPKNAQIHKDEIIRPKYRDYTQERLDREERELHGVFSEPSCN